MVSVQGINRAGNAPRALWEGGMARGWESKSVEDQQQEAERRRGENRIRESAAMDRRRTVELARAQTVSLLALARTPAQREALERALADLDSQLSQVS
jgi:hypothetical protein